MPDIQIDERIINFLMFLPLFFISLAVHEFAHAYSAFKLGDNTAKNEGRLTLNPIKHIDIIGSLVMPLMAFASGFALIGWAKPVPVNRANFKNELKDDAIVSVAGPVSNLILAFFFFVVFYISVNFLSLGENGNFLLNILWYAFFLNIFLCFFNLLPIPPLDGSHILYDLFPNRFTAKLLNLGFYGSFLLLIFFYSPLWRYFMKFIYFIIEIFISVSGIR